jgi:hypothetical protein
MFIFSSGHTAPSVGGGDDSPPATKLSTDLVFIGVAGNVVLEVSFCKAGVPSHPTYT